MKKELLEHLSKEDLIDYILEKDELYNQLDDLYKHQKDLVKNLEGVFAEYITSVKDDLPAEKKTDAELLIMLLKS